MAPWAMGSPYKGRPCVGLRLYAWSLKDSMHESINPATIRARSPWTRRCPWGGGRLPGRAKFPWPPGRTPRFGRLTNRPGEAPEESLHGVQSEDLALGRQTLRGPYRAGMVGAGPI